MWWDKIESSLRTAFTVYARKEGRAVHSNGMKLIILLKKVNANFLQQIISSIEVDMTRIPTAMTYKIALTNFRNKMNSKFSNPTSTPHRARRQIQ